MYCAHCGSEVQSLAVACPSCGLPASGAPASAAGGSKAAIIAIAVVVGGLALIAIVGVIAAIAIPNFVNAMERGRQKRTMADMRMIANGLESFALDEGYYPPAESIEELARELEPAYVDTMPTTDGWKNYLWYECWREDPSAKGCDRFILVAAARDGEFELARPRDYAGMGTETSNADQDIVWYEGEFTRDPTTAR